MQPLNDRGNFFINLTFIKTLMDYYTLLTGLLERVSGFREDRPTAGTKYRLMGLVADIAEVVHALQDQVLQRVSQEAVLDVDVDIDYAELSEQVLMLEYEEYEAQDEAVREQAQQVNEGLSALSGVLTEIDNQLERRHKDEEYVRLYMSELKRYNASSTVRRAKKNYEKWKENECYGNPTADDLEGYRLCKLLKMFEKGVFNDKVAINQRNKRYPEEVDFSQVDDDHPLKKTAYKHYAALRKIVDFRDGYLVVNPAHVGQYFFVTRKDENAKVNRTNFLKYMHKIGLAQEDERRLLAAQSEAAKALDEEPVQLNYFAPTKNLKMLLREEWFGMVATDDKKYDSKWTDGFVEALMASAWRDPIAKDWSVKDKRLTLKCMIIGALKDSGVLRGSYNSIAKLLDMDDENPATLAKYMGLGKKQGFAQWIEDYVKLHSGTDPTV